MQYAAVALPVIQGLAAITGGSAQRQLAEVTAAQDVALAQMRATSELQVAALQSGMARLQATAARLEHQRTANDVLRRINATQAAIRARAAAGGVRFDSGSAERVAAEAGYLGAQDFDIALENANFAERFGFMQADLIETGASAQADIDLAAAQFGASSTRAAGRIAETQGFLQGLGFFGEAAYKGYKLRTPKGTGGPQPRRSSLIGDFSLEPLAYG
jgi:hypothetical protein